MMMLVKGTFDEKLLKLLLRLLIFFTIMGRSFQMVSNSFNEQSTLRGIFRCRRKRQPLGHRWDTRLEGLRSDLDLGSISPIFFCWREK